MLNFPLTFSGSARMTAGSDSTWPASAQSEFNLTCAVPPEFAGPGGGASPEDLYVLALLNCFLATFKVMAEKSRISFSEALGEGKLIIDRDAKGVPWMQRTELRVEIHGIEQPERVLRLAQKVLDSGMILRSVRTQLSLELSLVEADSGATQSHTLTPSEASQVAVG
jgi:organic hydroperoxide reductase OsmC/OhrA